MTASPVCGWGTPMTPTSATSACAARTSSTSAGIDVEAGHDHEVLGPLDEVEAAVLVAHPDVTGAQPAVRGEHPRRRLRIVEVAGEHVRPTHPDLTGITHEGVPAVVVDDAQLDPAEHPADRPVDRRRADRGRHDRRRLRQAVALGDAQPEALLEPLGDADRAASPRRTARGGPRRRRRPAPRRSGRTRSTSPARRGSPRSPGALIDSSAVAGSNRCTSTTVAPLARLMVRTTLSPKMWYNGMTPYTTSPGATRLVPNGTARCSRAGCRGSASPPAARRRCRW